MITYIATNTLNGKFYIGSTVDFKKRRKNHLTCKVKSHFHHALRKNPEAFVWETFEDDNLDPVLEQALLDVWFGKEQCYNLNPVAGRPPSHKGVKRTAEQVEKSAAKRRGVKRTPEQCSRISKGLTGRSLTASQLESVRRNSQTANEKRKRKVELTHLQTGEFLVFNSVSEAQNFLGFGNIARACREPHRTVKGYKARYICDP
jgi:group I intron endonuclease